LPPTAPSSNGDIAITELAAGLQQPVALAFLRPGRVLVVQRQSTRLVLLDKSGRRGEIAFDDPAAQVLTGEDAGLLDIALHPDYARNGWIYLSYASGEAERSTTVVDRFRLQDDRVVSRERLFAARAWSEDRFHYGGRLAFSGGRLLLTVGDRHHQDRAQQLDHHAGKILRLADDGSIPDDNPFVARADAAHEIYSYGHRNPQGLVVDARVGTIWAHEHGPRAGDELNRIDAGANYGWPVISYGWQYDGGPIGQGITVHEGMEQPLRVWVPAIAPSGLIVYSGKAFRAWRDNLLLGSMSQRAMVRLALRDGSVVLEERLLHSVAGRVRLVAEAPDGAVLIGNDDGRLLRLTPADRHYADP
jgi:glucose/arabinose dehydrogenase